MKCTLTCTSPLHYRRSIRSATQALASPYVQEFHNTEEEPGYPHGVITIPIEDNTKLSAADYRDRLYREISNHKKALRRRNERGGSERERDGGEGGATGSGSDGAGGQ